MTHAAEDRPQRRACGLRRLRSGGPARPAALSGCRRPGVDRVGRDDPPRATPHRRQLMACDRAAHDPSRHAELDAQRRHGVGGLSRRRRHRRGLAQVRHEPPRQARKVIVVKAVENERREDGRRARRLAPDRSAVDGDRRDVVRQGNGRAPELECRRSPLGLAYASIVVTSSTGLGQTPGC